LIKNKAKFPSVLISGILTINLQVILRVGPCIYSINYKAPCRTTKKSRCSALHPPELHCRLPSGAPPQGHGRGDSMAPGHTQQRGLPIRKTRRSAGRSHGAGLVSTVPRSGAAIQAIVWFQPMRQRSYSPAELVAGLKKHRH